MSDTEAHVLQQLRIPPQPKVVREIGKEIQKPNVHLQTVAGLIAADASMAGGVLSVVNSPLFRRNHEVHSVKDAVRILGLARSHSVVRTIALRNAVAHFPDMERFGKRSARVAEACVIAARALKRPDLEDDAYLMGLFHLIGVPALRSVFKEAYADIERRATMEGWSNVWSDEERQWQTHHARMGALIVQHWHVSPAVVQATDRQHDWAELNVLQSTEPDAAALLVILKLALRATQVTVQEITYDEWDDMTPAILYYLWNVLGLENLDALEALTDQIAVEAAAVDISGA